MNAGMGKSFGAELQRIGSALKESAAWPSPTTGLALQLLQLCGCEDRKVNLLGSTPFPSGPLDAAPAAATAGFAIAVAATARAEELSRWRDGLKRLAKREPFPRDRQTFAYRPTELVGLAVGICTAEDRSSAVRGWIRGVLQDLPSKNPPTNAWALLLYHYAGAILDVSFPVALPARMGEYDTAELALLIALLEKGRVLNRSEFDVATFQNGLLERVLTESPLPRDTEKLAAIFGALSLSLRGRLATASKPGIPRAVKSVRQPKRGKTMKQKILFLAANPTNETRLALDKECREIESKIQASEHRDKLELLTKWAVRPNDLLQHLHQHSPHIVHFSGHGSPSEQLILIDANDESKPVSKAALKQLFTTLKGNIRAVVLNACFSRPQAEAITEVIDCAIGMDQAIGDEAAITFSAAFYQAIGFGRSIKVAFESGKAALLLDGIPEENTPVLMSRAGVNPDTVFLI